MINEDDVQAIEETELGPTYKLNIGTTDDGEIVLSVHVDEISYNILCESEPDARNTARNWCTMMSERFAGIAAEIEASMKETEEEE